MKASAMRQKDVNYVRVNVIEEPDEEYANEIHPLAVDEFIKEQEEKGFKTRIIRNDR